MLIVGVDLSDQVEKCQYGLDAFNIDLSVFLQQWNLGLTITLERISFFLKSGQRHFIRSGQHIRSDP